MGIDTDFRKFYPVIFKYMESYGEGKTKASQIATAMHKLIYKWFNDGDVYDNTIHRGWANNISNYANWLDTHTDKETSDILGRVLVAKECCDCVFGAFDYEEILYDLAEHLLNEEYLEEMSKIPKEDTIYSNWNKGRFQFDERNHME